MVDGGLPGVSEGWSAARKKIPTFSRTVIGTIMPDNWKCQDGVHEPFPLDDKLRRLSGLNHTSRGQA
jgi:hypothetical protein